MISHPPRPVYVKTATMSLALTFMTPAFTNEHELFQAAQQPKFAYSPPDGVKESNQ